MPEVVSTSRCLMSQFTRPTAPTTALKGGGLGGVILLRPIRLSVKRGARGIGLQIPFVRTSRLHNFTGRRLIFELKRHNKMWRGRLQLFFYHIMQTRVQPVQLLGAITRICLYPGNEETLWRCHVTCVSQ